VFRTVLYETIPHFVSSVMSRTMFYYCDVSDNCIRSEPSCKNDQSEIIIVRDGLGERSALGSSGLPPLC
jgi:hypothetical protein